MIGILKFTNERAYYVSDSDVINDKLLEYEIKDENIINIDYIGERKFIIYYRINDND